MLWRGPRGQHFLPLQPNKQPAPSLGTAPLACGEVRKTVLAPLLYQVPLCPRGLAGVASARRRSTQHTCSPAMLLLTSPPSFRHSPMASLKPQSKFLACP